MGQTFKAICPEAKTLHTFELVSKDRKTVGWCTKCLRDWPLAELSDGQGDDPVDRKPRRPKRK